MRKEAGKGRRYLNNGGLFRRFSSLKATTSRPDNSSLRSVFFSHAKHGSENPEDFLGSAEACLCCGISISMDDKGRFLDNSKMERFW